MSEPARTDQMNQLGHFQNGLRNQIGNAAIEGASIALLSKTRRDGLEALVRRIEHVELETDPIFSSIS